MRASAAMLRSWRARPPYCSDLSSRAAPGRGLCVALVRGCGCARLSRPQREQARGGAGARAVRVQLRPPLGVAVPPGGGGTPPLPRGGGVEGRRPCGPQAGGGRGERGGGAAVPCPPFSGGLAPPLGILVQRGCRAAVGAECGLVGRQWVSVAEGWGREVTLPRSAASRPPRMGTEAARFACSLLGAAVLPRPTASAQSRRSAAGNAGVRARPTGGAWRAVAPAAAVASPSWVQRPSRWGAWAAALLTGWRGAGGGEGVGGRGGSPQSPPCPLAPPPDCAGLVRWFRSPGGRLPTGGAYPSPAPLSPSRHQ